jgi:hypothetical protein
VKSFLIVVGVIGLAVALTWDKFQALDQYGVESAVRGAVAEFRMGRYTVEKPPRLWESTIYPAPHPAGTGLVEASTAAVKDSGYWGRDPKTGHVFIDCAHTDSKGSVWAQY